MILSLVNFKGGVGKTTTTVNLAAAFAETGLRTLVVDLDPQASASYSLGAPEVFEGLTLGDVLLLGYSAKDAVWPTGLEGVDCLVGDVRLATAGLALARRYKPEAHLAEALKTVRRKYDVILIDSPPGLSLSTSMALKASQAYIAPTTAQDLSVDALRRFFEGIGQVKSTIGRGTQLLGIAVTMVDGRVKRTPELVKEIRSAYGAQVFKTTIPVNVRMAEAPRYGCTILEYDSKSPGGKAYRKLGGEVLRRMRRQGLL